MTWQDLQTKWSLIDVIKQINKQMREVVTGVGGGTAVCPVDGNTETQQIIDNHLFQYANDAKIAIAAAIGSPEAASTDTFVVLAGDVLTDRTALAAALDDKGVLLTGTEDLAQLVALVSTIFGGAKWITLPALRVIGVPSVSGEILLEVGEAITFDSALTVLNMPTFSVATAVAPI